MKKLTLLILSAALFSTLTLFGQDQGLPLREYTPEVIEQYIYPAEYLFEGTVEEIDTINLNTGLYAFLKVKVHRVYEGDLDLGYVEMAAYGINVDDIPVPSLGTYMFRAIAIQRNHPGKRQLYENKQLLKPESWFKYYLEYTRTQELQILHLGETFDAVLPEFGNYKGFSTVSNFYNFIEKINGLRLNKTDNSTFEKPIIELPNNPEIESPTEEDNELYEQNLREYQKKFRPDYKKKR
jgi:hypothetical protein